MDNVRVIINGSEVGYYSPSEMGLAITWQNKVVGEVNTHAIPFTKTIRLPLTKALSIALRYPQILDSLDYVNTTAYDVIQIAVNEAISVYGYIKPIRTVVNATEEYIEFSIYPKQKTWVEQLSQFDMCDLDLSDQDHFLTEAVIRDSENLDPSRIYVYAPMDIAEITRLPVLWVEQSGTDLDFYYLGQQVSLTDFIGTTYGFDNLGLHLNWQNFTDVPDATWNGKNIWIARTQGTVFPSTKTYGEVGYLYIQNFEWQVGDFYPLINIKNLMERAFEHIGYTLSVPDSDDYLDDKYHFQHNIELLNEFEEPRNKYKGHVHSGGFTWSGKAVFGAGTDYIMPFRNLDETGFFQNANFVDTDNDDSAVIDAGNNRSEFKVTETSIVRFVWHYHIHTEITATTRDVPLEYAIELLPTGGSLTPLSTILYMKEDQPATFTYPASGGVERRGTLQSSYVYMEAGERVHCKLFIRNGNFASTATVTIYDDNVFESFMYKGGNFRNKTIRLNEYLPKQDALTWLKDIAFINNLQFYTNEEHKLVYAVRDDYKQTGKKIDFKDRINISRDVEIEEIRNLYPKTQIFNWRKDSQDWSIDFIELAEGERFAKGEFTNPSLFVKDETEYSCNLYCATLDKFEATGIVQFNTVEMKGKETWKSLPTWKRVDYLPRYLRIIFGEDVEDNALPYNGGFFVPVYSIEGNGTSLTYPRVEFQTDLHFSSLLDSKYANFQRRINHGQIIRAFVFVKEKDIDFIATILEEDNDFRADYDIQLKGVGATCELNKIIDYSPANQEETQVEFVYYKDE